MNFESVATLAINYGVVPVLFLFLMVHLVRQNRDLQRQNEAVLMQMMQMVREVVQQKVQDGAIEKRDRAGKL